MASYPSSLPALSTTNTNSTASTNTHPSLHNSVNDEVNAICAELGTLPKGAFATVKARLDQYATDIANATINVLKGGVSQGTRHKLNLIQGANITLTVADNAGTGAVDVTIASTASVAGGSAPYTTTNVTADRNLDATNQSLNEIANVLGTLIADLKVNGVISG